MAASFEKEFIDAKMSASGTDELRKALSKSLKQYFGGKTVLGLTDADDAVARFVDSAVGAFFEQDLFSAVRMLLGNAKGSFGLFVSCSLDAHRQVVLAARGQTISVAFYPAQNLILWASEQVGLSEHRVAFCQAFFLSLCWNRDPQTHRTFQSMA
jgi:hypothetical protein